MTLAWLKLLLRSTCWMVFPLPELFPETIGLFGEFQAKLVPGMLVPKVIEVVCPEQRKETAPLICSTGSGVTLKTRLTGTPGQLLAVGVTV